MQVTFDGLDEGPLASVPDFVKALDIDHALQPEVTVAYSMNGEPLPALERLPGPAGRPRLVRHLLGQGPAQDHRPAARLRRLLDGQGVQDPGQTRTGSRVPDAKLSDHLIPINRMNVRSFVTTPEPGSTVPAGPGRRGRGDRLRRRQRHPRRRGLGRRRIDLGRGRAGRRPGPVFLPPLALPLDPGVTGRASPSGPGHGP